MTTAQMSTIPSVGPGAWERLAELANEHDGGRVTAEKLRHDYIRAVEIAQESRDGELLVERPKPELEPSGKYHVGPYEIKIYGVLTLGIEGWFQPGADWSFEMTAYLKLLGSKVWETHYVLSPENTSITYHPDFKVVKGNFTIGIFGSTHCLRIYGDACYRGFSGWHCKDFDETLHCFG
jgi:hypothetical protein